MDLKEMNMFGEGSSHELSEVLENREKGNPAFGIDLGTTNSAISVLRNGRYAEIIPVGKYGSTLPSCVMWKGKDDFIVGEEAYANRYKESAIYSVKRLMGSNEKVTLKYGGKTKVMTPAEVSAEILKELVKRASLVYGDIKDVVISVPAHFNNLQIEDTIKAGELAGLNVLTTIKEPTAAAINYEDEDEGDKDEVSLVYDLGGGTFDITLLRISRTSESSVTDDDFDDFYGLDNDESESVANTVLKVIATDGDTKLGGDDIDNEMFNIIMKKLSDLNYDIRTISIADRESIKLQLEKIKKQGIGFYTLPLDFKLLDGKGTRVKENIDITEDDFYKSAEIIYRKTKALIDRVIHNSMVDIAQIILVGGSTKSAAIRSFLERDYPDIKINYSLQPDEAVALGAGIQAYRTKYGTKDVQVFDVIPLAIGVLSDGYITKQIAANTTIPYSALSVYSTLNDNQEQIQIAVYQGNSVIKEECTYLGHLVINNIPKKPAGEVKAYVNLAVNAKGVLKCTVRVGENTTEKELVNIFTGTSNEVNKVSNKKLLRWTKFASTLDDVNRERLNELLAEYPNNPSIESTIVDFIRSCRRSVDDLIKSKDEPVDVTGTEYEESITEHTIVLK